MDCAGAGTMLLSAAFGLSLLSCAALFVSVRIAPGTASDEEERAAALSRTGAWLFAASAAAALGCLLLLAWCFLFDDTSVRYAVYYRSDSSSGLAWLFKLSGIWGGSEGSLLLWAFLVTIFGLPAARRCIRPARGAGHLRLDAAALGVMALVATAFLGFVLLVEGNRVFEPMPSELVDAEGNLVGAAMFWGLSALLEHWAMAVHPPLLFVGYAGLTVPFAYAVATFLADDGDGAWVRRARVPLLVAWLFLTLGIATGGAWAYSVLGWGGYWGWDAVENASLLPWLASVSLVHSFDALLRRGMFRAWSPFCACLAFSFVGLDAFITRSGVIGSVHAFAGNDASSVLFGAVTLVPLALGAAVARHSSRRMRKQANAEQSKEVAWGACSRETAYFLGNVLVFALAFVVAYATLAPALPPFMPLGGRTMPPAAYNAIAAPLTAIYLLLMAVCPLAKWSEGREGSAARRFGRDALGAIALGAAPFAVVVFYWAFALRPVVGGGDAGSFFQAAMVGPAWYVEGVALAVLAVAALSLGSALWSFVRAVQCRVRSPRDVFLHIGVVASHAGMAVLAIGLVGSMLYTTSRTFEILIDRETGEAVDDSATLQLDGYCLHYEGMASTVEANRTDLFSTVTFSVERGGRNLGTVAPSVQAVATMKQTHFHAAILAQPLEDLFVVYKGTASVAGADDAVMRLVVEMRVNRLVGFVWAGAALFVTGVAACAACRVGRRCRAGRRRP